MDRFWEPEWIVGVSPAAAAVLTAALLVRLRSLTEPDVASGRLTGHLPWWAAGLAAIALLEISLTLTMIGPQVFETGDAFAIFTTLLAQTAGACAAVCLCFGAWEKRHERPPIGPASAAAIPLLVLLPAASLTLGTIDSTEATRRFVATGPVSLLIAAGFAAVSVSLVRGAGSKDATARVAPCIAATLAGTHALVFAGEASLAWSPIPAPPPSWLGAVPIVDALLLSTFGVSLTLSALFDERTRRGASEARAQTHAATARDAQHLETVGRIVESVAHDYNNLLTALSGYSRLLVERLPADTKEQTFASEIREASERAIELTTQLQALSRRRLFRPTILALDAHLRQYEQLLRRMVGDDVKLVTRYGGRDLTVRADPGQLEQLLHALVANARESMPDGGTLTLVTSEHIEPAVTREATSGLVPGRYLRLSVEDTGHGFDRRVGERIFEPYFTTHGDDGASGLGLSTVRGVVKQCGGAIAVDSEPGHGTAFQIFLPTTSRESAAPATPIDEPAAAPGARVLVVEDESSVLALVELVLREAGYHVATSKSPTAAIEIFRRESDGFDLLLTDLQMPEMDGRELADRLLADRPDLRVVFMTGFPREPITARSVGGEGTADIIRKPFTADVVLRTVREALGPRIPR